MQLETLRAARIHDAKQLQSAIKDKTRANDKLIELRDTEPTENYSYGYILRDIETYQNLVYETNQKIKILKSDIKHFRDCFNAQLARYR